mmetsp:Transcript_34206/g.69845  ORF Transcript_34206/g.69845 Transcript_34206/m.69845 type:complete len:273 (+) Transcript_34206:1026-1844(+)
MPFTLSRTCPSSTPAERAEDPSTINATTGLSSNALTSSRSVLRKSESVSSCGLKNITPRVGVKMRASYHSPPGGRSPSLRSDTALGPPSTSTMPPSEAVGGLTGAGTGSGAGGGAGAESATGAPKVPPHGSLASATGCDAADGAGGSGCGAGADAPNMPNGSSDGIAVLGTMAPGGGGAVDPDMTDAPPPRDWPQGSSAGASAGGAGAADIADAIGSKSPPMAPVSLGGKELNEGWAAEAITPTGAGEGATGAGAPNGLSSAIGGGPIWGVP